MLFQAYLLFCSVKLATYKLACCYGQKRFCMFDVCHLWFCLHFTDSLAEPKRVDLVMHLFKTNNTPTETAAMEKLVTWWYYVQCLGSRVWHHFDQVSVSFHLSLSLSQFLCFMYKFHSFMHASSTYYKLCPVVLLFVVRVQFLYCNAL